jgi:hypothetical protein
VSVLIACLALRAQTRESTAQDGPQFTSDHRMLRPDHYREWIYLTSGLGMSYSAALNMDPLFDNVFVNPTAYRSFLETGTWPNRTVLVLEIRGAESKGSINRAGHFQGGIKDVEVHVKDSSLPGQWAFFGFSGNAKSAAAIPQTAECYSCHQQHGAVDTTFLQFYPTLVQTARTKGTLRPSY